MSHTRDQRLPDAARLAINGAVFVHWYDCLTDVSLGLDTRRHALRGKT